jgi:hypothetical protein
VKRKKKKDTQQPLFEFICYMRPFLKVTSIHCIDVVADEAQLIVEVESTLEMKQNLPIIEVSLTY